MSTTSDDRSKVSRLALSVRQPWAELILLGRKRIEVRTWSDSYLGPLWLHAGRQIDDAATRHFGLTDTDLFAGGFVGMVVLLDIVPFGGDRWEKWRPQHLVPGPPPREAFAWMLSEPRRLRPPLAARGHLRLFQVDEETDRQLGMRLRS